MEGKILLKGEHIVKEYGSGSGKTVALNDVSFEIYEGELLVILGNSGSGKSTLLNMIGGMDRPTSGRIFLRGEDISGYNDRRLTDYRKKKVGFIFQSFNLIQELTAYENVALTAQKGLQKRELLALFQVAGLGKKLNQYPSQLSGGEQQRVSITRALAKQSEFLLCDEPTGALDYETGKQILIYLEKLVREQGKTVVLVTHTQEIGQMADRILKVRNGKITEQIVNQAPVRAELIEW